MEIWDRERVEMVKLRMSAELMRESRPISGVVFHAEQVRNHRTAEDIQYSKAIS